MSETPTPPSAKSESALVQPRRRRWVSVLLAMLLLCSGAAIGSGVTVLVIVRQVQYRLLHPDEFADRAVGRLRRSFALTDEQTKAARVILHERQAAVQKIRREFQPRLEVEVDRLRAEIAQILTPQQAGKWTTWLDKKRKTWLPPLPKPTGDRN